MKRISYLTEWFSCSVAVALLLAAGSGFAQTARLGAGQAKTAVAARGAATAAGVGGEKGERVIIKRMPPPNKTAMVRTPEYGVNAQNTMPKISKKQREWALFEVKYETEAKWMDEVTFVYHVMTKGRNEEGKDAFSYYTATVRYIDVPKGEHMSCVAIPPSLVERYGEPVAVALEIIGKDGTVLDSKSESLMKFPSEKWWTDTQVMDNQSVPVARRNGMVDRSKTPFALINTDDYEVVQ